jgi:peptide/nickel transport system substrate-binding protein
LTNQTLLTLNEDGTVGPGLASSFAYIGTGNKVFQLTLRKDVKFADGTPLDAQAVKTWLDYYAKTPGPFQANLKVGSVDVVSKYQVNINLAEPNPLVPWVLSTWTQGWGSIASPKAVANPQSLATNPDGAGPYMIDTANTVTGDHYTFVQNPYYYDKSQPRFKTIVYKVITSPSSLLQAAQSGQVDVYLAGGTAYPTVKAAQKAGLSIAPFTGLTDYLLFGNLSTGPFSKLQVRQAVSYALNRDSINKVENLGFGTAVSAMPTLDNASAQLPNPYPYNPAKAKQLLAEAGYPNGFSTNTTCAAGNLTQCQAIAQSLKDVGITMKIDVDINSSQVPKFQSGARQTFVCAWPMNYNLFNYASFWGPKATFRVTKPTWSDPKIDSLYQQALTATPAESTKLMGQLATYVDQQAYFAPVYNNATVFVYNPKKVSGIKSSTSLFAYSMANLANLEPPK